MTTCFEYGGGDMYAGTAAGSGGGKYNADSPTQGGKRGNSIRTKIHFAHLGILFIYGCIRLCFILRSKDPAYSK